MNIRYLLSYLLILSLILIILGSCASENTSREIKPNSSNTVSTNINIDEEYKMKKANYDGYDFRILCVETLDGSWVGNLVSEVEATEQNGEPMNDAVYARNMELEEAYNVNVSAVTKSRGDICSFALQCILAGDDIFDVVFVRTASAKTLLQTPNTLHNLADIESIDLSNPWWDQNSVQGLSVFGKIYSAANDVSFRTLYGTTIVLFNSAMIKSYSLEDPYELVDSGKWTIDKMTEMARNIAHDLDGDGAITDKDIIGYFGENVNTKYFFTSAGLRTVEIDEKERSIKPTFFSDRAVLTIEKAITLTNASFNLNGNNYGKLYPGENVYHTRAVPLLEENRLLFYHNSVIVAIELRNMESDFGILPTPKLDETQDNYYSTCNQAYEAPVGIPTTITDTERSGTLLEAIGYLSRKYVRDAIYETTLTVKSLRDENAVRMLDLVDSSRVYDIGFIYDWGGVGSMLVSMCSTNNTDLASKYAGVEPLLYSNIEDYLKTLK